MNDTFDSGPSVLDYADAANTWALSWFHALNPPAPVPRANVPAPTLAATATATPMVLILAAGVVLVLLLKR
jgi:hypothetical protein